MFSGWKRTSGRSSSRTSHTGRPAIRHVTGGSPQPARAHLDTQAPQARRTVKGDSRSVSLGLFVLVLLCFLLPFARVTCNKKELGRASGYEVAFGKEVKVQRDPNSEAKTMPTGRDVVAITCLVAAAVGIGLVFVSGRRGAAARAVLSGHGLLLLLLLRIELRNLAHENRVALEMLVGYWAALALFSAAGLVNLLSLRRGPRRNT